MRLQKLIQQQQSAKTLRERIDTTLSIAIFYFDQSNFQSAIREYKSVLQLYESSLSTDKIQIALTHRYIAECYLELGDFNEAIKHSSQYLKIAKEVNNVLEQQRAFVTIGRCFQCRADNVYNGQIARRSLLAAQQAMLNSIKITTQLSNLTSSQIAEIKAVSLLNLGHIFRSYGDCESAHSRFDQCINICRKYSLVKIMLRATFQQCEIPLIQWPSVTQSRCRPSDLLNYTEADNFSQAINLCSQTLKFYAAHQCSDKEAKILRRNLEELLGQLYAGRGEYRVAAKIYRQLSRCDPESGLNYKDLCGKCLKLENITIRIRGCSSDTVEQVQQVSKYYEKLGDILSAIDLHAPAFRCYQQMYLWADAAFSTRQNEISTSDSMGQLALLAKQVDSGLVSAAEACASLGAHSLCAYYYRREILFNLSLTKHSLQGIFGLKEEELAQSWLSVARALIQSPKNEPPDFSNSDIGRVANSNTPEEALMFALSKARASKSVDVMRDCLDELLSYYKSCGREADAKPYLDELNTLTSTICNDRDIGGPALTTDSPERSKEESDSDPELNMTLQSEAIDEIVEVLSSDSDVEKCINAQDGPTDLIESGVKRRSRALCLKTNLKGESPLHVASINGNLEHVVKLVEVLGHPINVRDGAGWLPIHEAAFHDHADIAVYLLDKGAYLDDMGCQEDLSTPLFEAIHGDALKTAIVLVNRGANLWHVNAEGETLSDLLNNWQPKKRGPSGTESQKTLFNQLLHTVKANLGDSYEKWCSYRPPVPTVKASAKANGSVVIVNDCDDDEEKEHVEYDESDVTKGLMNEKPAQVIRSKSRKKSTSLRCKRINAESDEEDVGDENRQYKPKYSRPDCVIDLSSSSIPNVGVTNSKHNTAAVNDYRNVMIAVGSSATRRKRRTNGISTDLDDSWLEDDESEPKRKQVKRRKNDFFSSTSPRHSPFQRQKPSTDSKCFNLSRLSEPVDLDSSRIFTSSQVHPSMISQLPLPQFPSPHLSPVQKPKEKSPPPSQGDFSQQCQTTGMVWCTVKVTFSDISLLLPVDSKSRTVKWLAEEAYRRHQLLLDQKVSDPGTTQVRIRTSDGALLLPTDFLCTVLPAASTASSATIPELMAEIVLPPKPPSKLAHESPPAFAAVRGSIKRYFKFSYLLRFIDHQIVPSVAQPIERATDSLQVVGNPAFIRLRQSIEAAVESGFLDLSFQALGARGCADALLEYLRVRPEARPLTKLCLDGNLLSSNDILPNSISSEKSSLLSVFHKVVTPHLKELSLADNLLTFEGVLVLLSSGSNLSSVSINHLTHLCLNYNPLFCQLTTTAGSSGTVIGRGFASPLTLPSNWLSVEGITLDCENSITVADSQSMLSSLLKYCPHLTCFQAVGCGVTPTIWELAAGPLTGDTFSTPPEKAPTNRDFAHLVELDISLNPLSSKIITTDEDFFLDLLTPPENKVRPNFSSIRILSLRGSLSSNPQKGKTAEPFLGGLTFSHDTWMLCKSSLQNNGLKPSGDAFISSLARFLDSGNCSIHTLDVGQCNLTEGCLMNFQRLLAAPSTTLTTLLCDGNPRLRQPSVWAKLLSTSAQATSALVSLSIDIPLLETDDDLTLVMEATSCKMSPATSQTPLQEFIIITSSPLLTWSTGHRLPVGRKVAIAPTMMTTFAQPSDPRPIRFLAHVAICFFQRFRKLANIHHQPHRTIFSIK